MKMIVMDMDGTLLNSNKEISNRTVKILKQLQQQGVRLVLASGRVKSRLEEYAKQLEIDVNGGFLIEANGSCIYSYEKDEREIVYQMSYEEADELFQFIRKHYPNNEIMVMADVNAYVYLPEGVKESSYFNTNHMESLKNREIIYYQDVHEIKERFFKVCTYDTPEKIVSIVDFINAHFSDRYWCGRTMPFWLEVVAKQVSKGNALSRIMIECGINEDDVYVFGDGENDISMLMKGHGVAMANAIGSVKQCCQWETKSCDEDGVAYFLERMLEHGKIAE